MDPVIIISCMHAQDSPCTCLFYTVKSNTHDNHVFQFTIDNQMTIICKLPNDYHMNPALYDYHMNPTLDDDYHMRHISQGRKS